MEAIHAARAQPVPVTGLDIALLIRSTIHRYSVEGMLHSRRGTDTVRSLPIGDRDVTGHRGWRPDILLAASTDLTSDAVRNRVAALRADGTRLLLLVDGPSAMDAPWTATCGAQGFLDWSELEPRTLTDAVSDVMADKFAMTPTLARALVVRAAQAPDSAPGAQPWGPPGIALTPRELQVLKLVAEGLSNKQVSRRLQISEHGVKRLVGNVLAKLNCPNRTLAVVRALEIGLLESA